MKVDFLLNRLSGRQSAEPVDAVKLLYQSEFGCGHALPAEEICAGRIRDEIAMTVADAKAPAFEPIGNGLCRLDLRNTQVRRLPPETIARMMRVTDTQVCGSQLGFLNKIKLLQETAACFGRDAAIAPQRLPFTGPELERYLAGDWLENLPPSHSASYREAYQPAYRVVLRRFGEALPALCRVEQALREQAAATLVLDGDCASGKTTLMNLLAPLYDCNVFHMDDFFLPFAMRSQERMAEPGGNVHYERFRVQVLAGLLTREPFAYDAFDCHRDVSRTVGVTPRPVTFIEGSYSLHPFFDAAYAELNAVRALMRVDREEQLRRIRLRNGEEMLRRFQMEWIPLEIRYLEAYHKAREDELILLSERHPEDEPAMGE